MPKFFFEKISWVEKNNLFGKIFENYFLENEIFENWSMAVWIWSVLGQLHRPITWIYITQKPHLITSNDSTHQDLWLEIKWEKNLMSDLGDIAISKNCQCYPNWHESIFEDWIFWKKFKNPLFPKSKKIKKKFLKKIFQKTFFFRKNFFKKKIMNGKKYFYAKFLKIIFQKMKSSKIDQWQFGYDHFLSNFIGPQRGYALPKWNISYL